MTIQEAIKFIVNRNDDSLLKDSKKFKAYLGDLCADNPKELNIVSRCLEDKILTRIFGNEKDYIKIAKLRDEFEYQGMSETWSEFIISSFAQVLGWNYEPKENILLSQKITENNNIDEDEENQNTNKEVKYIEVNLNDIILEHLYELRIINTNNKKELVSIDIPKTYKYGKINYKITNISKSFFEDCTSLKNVELPDSIEYISESTFEHCTSLKNIEIPINAKYIGESAFRGCTSLKTIELPDSIEYIGELAFEGCTSLKAIELPKWLYYLNSAFSNCSSLEIVKFRSYNKIQIIPSGTFEGCSSLKTIKIPKGIKEIEAYAFQNCTSLEEIDFSENENIQIINPGTFENCSSLKTIEIPINVKCIDASAFSGCTSLKKVWLCENLKSIQTNAFKNCTSLQSLKIPTNVNYIGGESTFKGVDTIYYEGSDTLNSPWGAKHHLNNPKEKKEYKPKEFSEDEINYILKNLKN